MIMTSAFGFPVPKTMFVALFFKGQPLKFCMIDFKSSRDEAFSANKAVPASMVTGRRSGSIAVAGSGTGSGVSCTGKDEVSKRFCGLSRMHSSTPAV